MVTNEKVKSILRLLRITEGPEDYSPPACVKADGSMPTNSRSHAYYAVAALEGNPTKLSYCASNADDPAFAGSACIRYAGSKAAVSALVIKAAGAAMFKTTIEEVRA